MRRNLLTPIISLLLITFACIEMPVSSPPTATSAPASTDTPTVTPVPTPVSSELDKLQTLLEYIPYEWADEHPALPLGPDLHFIDIARMRIDLEVPPTLSGTDDRQAKLALITGMSTQSGLPPCTSGAAYDEWGWDIADIDQMLCTSLGEACIFLGNFRPEVRERLLEKSYTEREFEGYTVFTSESEELVFALKGEDTLLEGYDESAIEDLIRQKTGSQDGADQHPSVIVTIEHLGGVWGAFLAPSGDMTAFGDSVREYYHQLPEDIGGPLIEAYQLGDEKSMVAWDFMAIGFTGSQQDTNTLNFLYHYPSEEEAEKDVELVTSSMTERPRLTGNHVWGDSLDLQNVEVHDTILKATATTQSKTLMGSTFVNRDLGFLPIRAVPRTTAPTIASTLESGWILYEKPDEGFAIALPPEWQEVNLDPKTLDASFAALAAQNPKFEEMFSRQELQSLAAQGIQFFGLDLSPEPWEYGLPVSMSIQKTVYEDKLSLDDYAPVVLEQIETIAAPETPVTHQRVLLANVEAEEFRYRMEMTAATGEDISATLTAYWIIDGYNHIVIAMGCPTELADTYAPVFEEIAQSLRLLE